MDNISILSTSIEINILDKDVSQYIPYLIHYFSNELYTKCFKSIEEIEEFVVNELIYLENFIYEEIVQKNNKIFVKFTIDLEEEVIINDETSSCGTKIITIKRENCPCEAVLEVKYDN